MRQKGAVRVVERLILQQKSFHQRREIGWIVSAVDELAEAMRELMGIQKAGKAPVNFSRELREAVKRCGNLVARPDIEVEDGARELAEIFALDRLEIVSDQIGVALNQIVLPVAELQHREKRAEPIVAGR